MAATIYERNSCARGGGGVINKYLFGEAPPRGSTPSSPFMYHFLRKRDPFPVDKWYPFHIPCLELCILFNYCKCTVFHSRNQSQKKNVFSTLYSHKIHLLALLGPFTDPNYRFSYPFVYFKELNPYSFVYLRPEKGTPFGRSLSRIGHYRDYAPRATALPVPICTPGRG